MSGQPDVIDEPETTQPSQPTVDPALFAELEARLAREGPAAAAEKLCSALRESGDYAGLFYALLLKKRLQMGVTPVPTGPAADLPAELHPAYEEAIREAGRLVGNLFLRQGDLPRAWAYFRMLGEPGPMVAAIDAYQPGEDADPQPVIEIAFHEGVSPRKGFDLLLGRYGICSAITTVHSHDFSRNLDVRTYCVERLTRALSDQLRERLRAEVAHHDGAEPPADATVAQLIDGRDWLFGDDFYHIDVSHLSAVVQMSPLLPAGPDLELARQLCLYGERLSPAFRYAGDPPFEDTYRDHRIYLEVVSGERMDEGLAHFRGKADAGAEEGSTYPAEVLVNLLLRLERPTEALAVAQKYLANAGTERPLTCPSLLELCQKCNDYRALAETARGRNDPVHFLAGLIATAR
jgi:hypothetical protein